MALGTLQGAACGPCSQGAHSWPAGKPVGLTKEASIFQDGAGEPLNNFEQGSDDIQCAFDKDHSGGWIGDYMLKDSRDLMRKLLQ